jgi:hypothetical protein
MIDPQCLNQVKPLSCYISGSFYRQSHHRAQIGEIGSRVLTYWKILIDSDWQVFNAKLDMVSEWCQLELN